MAITDTWLKANNGKERAALEERCDREGLGVRVTPKGKITFQLRYRYQGKPKRLGALRMNCEAVSGRKDFTLDTKIPLQPDLAEDRNRFSFNHEHAHMQTQIEYARADKSARQAIAKAKSPRIHRAARSVRSAVRPSFAAKKAAKADSGGGSSDPDGRQPHPYTFKNLRNTLPVSAFLFGGAAK